MANNNGHQNRNRRSDDERRKKPNHDCNNHGDTCDERRKKHNCDCNNHGDKCKCDCCCTTGMREELKDLEGKLVIISTTGGAAGGIVPLVGVINDVDCDVVEFGFLAGLGLPISIPTFISLCEVTNVIDLSGLLGGGLVGVGAAAAGTNSTLLSLLAALGLGDVLAALGIDVVAPGTPPFSPGI